MSIVNINRDPLWIDLLQTRLALSGNINITGGIQMNSSGTVNDLVGSAASIIGPSKINIAVDTWQAYGVLMAPPLIENTPYRVKARVNHGAKCSLMIGYADSTSGTNDTIEEFITIPFQDYLDELIMLDYQEIGENYNGFPVAFGIIYEGPFNDYPRGEISVQNLSKAPPPIGMGVS